jgi:hypothetical protein
MWIHRVCGALIMILTIVFASILIHDNEGKILANAHSIIGVIILAVVMAITLFGVFTRSRMNRLKWNTAWIMRTKNTHKVSSIIFLFLDSNIFIVFRLSIISSLIS